jgi:Uma2 family endonuclease
MASASRKTDLTPEQYLVRERLAQFRSEYHDGQIRAMSGASRPHNLITVNLSSEINGQLKGRPCEVYSADMRVHVHATGDYFYPDIVAVCGEPRFLDGEFDTLINPQLIVEILSPSTEAYDRGEKFAQYQRIESLRGYVLIAQDEIRVERLSRQGDQWLLTTWDSAVGTLRLDSIDCDVRLSDIYAKVKFAD